MVQRDKVGQRGPSRAGARQVFLACVIGAVLLSGCSREEGRPIPESKVLMLVAGKTTEADVLTLLGPPVEKRRVFGVDLWVYRHIKSHGFMSVHTSSKVLRLRFDDRGVLQDVDRHDRKRQALF